MSQPRKSKAAPAPSPAPAEPPPYEPKVDRRTAMAWMTVVGAALGGAGVVVWGETHKEPSRRGYGTDPKLAKPEPAPWSRIMTREQLQAAALLADFILPASGAAPAASALGVPDFIDEWVSAPYPDQVKDRSIVLDGLNGLFWQAQRRFGVSFLAATPAQRAQIMADLQQPSAGARHAFFKKFRLLVVGAYYTTAAGFKDIGYIGNVARAADPGPSDAVKAAVEAQLGKLGL
jgi:hypothetical protein